MVSGRQPLTAQDRSAITQRSRPWSRPVRGLKSPGYDEACTAGGVDVRLLGAHCMTLMEYIETQRVDVLSVCGCGGSHPARQRAKNVPRQARTGWTATVLEPGCRAVEDLLATYRGSATVTFDPNVRPALITDAEQAKARIESLIERSDVVKASDEDLQWPAPNTAPEEVAQRWSKSGPALVAVTMGGAGAFAVSAAGLVRVPARSVQVIDTVGAGDSFMTGLLDALWSLGLLGADRRDALRRISTDQLEVVLKAAALNSALTVAHAGAVLPDHATREAAAHSPR